MTADKTITATLMDATYIGDRTMMWIPEERYRLRAVISKSGRVKIRLHENEDIERRYDSKDDFYMDWMDEQRLGTCNWERDM